MAVVVGDDACCLFFSFFSPTSESESDDDEEEDPSSLLDDVDASSLPGFVSVAFVLDALSPLLLLPPAAALSWLFRLLQHSRHLAGFPTLTNFHCLREYDFFGLDSLQTEQQEAVVGAASSSSIFIGDESSLFLDITEKD